MGLGRLQRGGQREAAKYGRSNDGMTRGHQIMYLKAGVARTSHPAELSPSLVVVRGIVHWIKKGHREVRPATSLEYPGNFAQHCVRVPNMLQDLQAGYVIKCTVGKRQPACVTKDVRLGFVEVRRGGRVVERNVFTPFGKVLAQPTISRADVENPARLL